MKKQKKQKQAKLLTVDEHIKELRTRIIRCLIVMSIFFLLAYYYNKELLDFCLKIGRNGGFSYFSLSAQETLIQTLRICFVFSLICSFPSIFYEGTIYLLPAVEDKKAKRQIVITEFIGIIFFVIGFLFAYSILLPFSLKYLNSYSIERNISSQISLENYISFILNILIYIGLIFEAPIICSLLAKFGLLNKKMMIKARSFIIISLFIIAAIITPPDVVSQLIVVTPMIFLYFISVKLVSIFEKKNKKLPE